MDSVILCEPQLIWKAVAVRIAQDMRELSEAQHEARRLYAEAEAREAEDPLEAAKLYRRAFKVDPSLEVAVYNSR